LSGRLPFCLTVRLEIGICELQFFSQNANHSANQTETDAHRVAWARVPLVAHNMHYIYQTPAHWQPPKRRRKDLVIKTETHSELGEIK
jgi:hypothetical protein